MKSVISEKPHPALFPPRIFFLAVLLFSWLFPSVPSHAASQDQISDVGFFLDTVVKITLNGTKDTSILDECFDLITRYENMLSRTREGSDVWNINHSQGQPVEVSEETAALLRIALHYSKLSEGAFDITMAPVITLWNFQENTGDIPSDEDIAAALAHVDYQLLALDGSTVTLKDRDASIDLGGIAKGFIADRLKELILSKDIDSALIDLGGNILTVGQKPDHTNWKIGIRKPFADASEYVTIVQTDGLSVVTSGTYERYFEVDGTIYHHILDPENGFPVQNTLQSVTILSEYSVDGDALSTTCFVLGLEHGMELIESLDNIEALFLTEDGGLHPSSGFPVS